MQKPSLTLLLLLAAFNAFAQITNVEEKFTLPEILNESSGVIFFNDKLISHNDSGNQNALYELDTISGTVTRTVIIDNATNVDWEDITQDSTSIYIGDIGNNNGNRTDLKIYKINKSDYLSATNITAEVINFTYADQVDFTSNPNNTEWDAEALINFDTSLILLTKNWVTGITKAYSIPKDSGTYAVDPLPTTLSSGGLITGATYDASTGTLYAVGYNIILQPFVWISEGFSGNAIFSGTNTQIPLPSLAFEQVEAITHITPDRYFITSESFNFSSFSDTAKVVAFSIKNMISSVEEQPAKRIRLYPNPVRDILVIDGEGFVSVDIYDTNARLVHQSNHQEVNIAGLNKGVYIARIKLADYTYRIEKIIKL